MTKMSNYLFNYNIITMAKKSVIIGEYVVTIEDTGTVSVSQIYKSTMQAMREMAALKGMEVPSNWNNHYLGKKLLDTYCGPGAQSGVIGEYSIERQPNGHIDVIRTFSNTIESLRLISDLIGYKYSEKWNTRTFGDKLVEYVEANKDSIKIAKPAKTQKKDAETGAPAAADNNHAPDGELNSASQHFDVVIPCIYDYAMSFNEGLAAVEKDDKWGCIDQTGKEVIPFIYDNIYALNDGLISVEKDDKCGCIDQTGKEVIPFIYDGIYRSGDGLLRVEKDGKYGYIDRTGKEIIPCIYMYACNNLCGFASVKKDDNWGCIDQTGKVVIPLIYDDIDGFYDGFAKIEKEGKYGLIDQTGKEVIPLIYDGIDSFCDGLAAVKKDGRWGYIGKVEK